MDANASFPHWESDLVELLDELSGIQGELLDVLLRKRELMVAGASQAMEQLQPREQALYERLEACRRRRGALLESVAGPGPPAASLVQLAEIAAPARRGKLGRQVQEASARMRLLQHHALTNWVLAQRTLLHVAQLLEVLATGGRSPATYNQGSAAVARGGALVDQEV